MALDGTKEYTGEQIYVIGPFIILKRLSQMHFAPQPQTNSVTHRPDQTWLVQAVVFGLILLAGIAGRYWLVEMPNFKPVAALVLFGAFYFQRSWLAIGVLLLIMAISDAKLGYYDWQLMLAVYGGLAVAGGLGFWIKKSIVNSARVRLGARQIGRFAVASLAMSTAFFVLTNAAVWWMGAWYPPTWTGLVDCFAAAVPFYRATLTSDLLFTGSLVSIYGVAESILYRRMESRAAALQFESSH